MLMLILFCNLCPCSYDVVSNFYFHLLQHQFMKWRNIVILKLRPKFRVFHPPKMVLEFSQRMNSFLFAFPPLFWPDVCLEIIGKQFLINKINIFFGLLIYYKHSCRWGSRSLSYGRFNGKSCSGWWWGLLLTLTNKCYFCQHWGLL